MSYPSMREARKSSGRTAEAVAKEVGIYRPNLYRTENGETLPSRELARALFTLYEGEVSLADIYDPEFAPIARKIRKRKGLHE